MSEYYTVVTNYGESAMSAAVNGASISLEYMVFGDGNGIQSNPNPNATQLVNERFRATLASLTTASQNSSWQVATATIPANAGGFTVREIGLVDYQGNLFALGSIHPVEKLAGNDPLLVGMSNELTIDCYFAVSNQANISFTINSSTGHATQDFVTNQLKSASFNAYFIGQS